MLVEVCQQHFDFPKKIRIIIFICQDLRIVYFVINEQEKIGCFFGVVNSWNKSTY